MSLPDHTANRLSDFDVETIRARMEDTVAGWQTNRTNRKAPWATGSHETLVRVGLGAIGCIRADMRDSEMAVIETLAREALAL